MEKKCKVVMLSTNEKSKIVQGYKQLFLNDCSYKDKEYQHLYILSDDEIKEGDWCIRNYGMGQEVVQYHRDYGNQCKKIIATTDINLGYEVDNKFLYGFVELPQPSQSFIEKYIEEYNKGNVITEVLVEYERDEEIEGYGYDILKVNPKDNTITISLQDKNSKLKELFIEFACNVYNENYGTDMSFQKRSEIMIDNFLNKNLIKLNND